MDLLRESLFDEAKFLLVVSVQELSPDHHLVDKWHSLWPCQPLTTFSINERSYLLLNCYQMLILERCQSSYELLNQQ